MEKLALLAGEVAARATDCARWRTDPVPGYGGTRNMRGDTLAGTRLSHIIHF